jgi:hypothetical protein
LQRALEKFVPSLEIGGKIPGSFQDTTYQCDSCHAEFQFQFQDIDVQADNKAQTLVITKWLELGDGLDPQSPFWVVQRHSNPKVHIPHRNVGSVRWRFENETGSLQQELTIRNGLLMSQERFGKDLCPYGSETWVGRPER